MKNELFEEDDDAFVSSQRVQPWAVRAMHASYLSSEAKPRERYKIWEVRHVTSWGWRSRDPSASKDLQDRSCFRRVIAGIKEQ